MAANTSPFLRLPGELRNRIYELALLEPNGIPLTIDKKTITSSRRTRPSNNDFNTAPKGYAYSKPLLLGLPLTCRQIRDETLKLYYSINELHLYLEGMQILGCHPDVWDAGKQGEQLFRWCKMIGLDKAKEIRKLRFDFGAMPGGGQGTRCLELANSLTTRAKNMLRPELELAFEIDMGVSFAKVGVPANTIKVELVTLKEAEEQVLASAKVARLQVNVKFLNSPMRLAEYLRVDLEELTLLSFVGKISSEVKAHMPKADVTGQDCEDEKE